MHIVIFLHVKLLFLPMLKQLFKHTGPAFIFISVLRWSPWSCSDTRTFSRNPINSVKQIELLKLKEAVLFRSEGCTCATKYVSDMWSETPRVVSLHCLGYSVNNAGETLAALATSQHIQECLDHLGQGPLCVFTPLPWLPLEFDTTSAAYSASLMMKSLQWKFSSYVCPQWSVLLQVFSFLKVTVKYKNICWTTCSLTERNSSVRMMWSIYWEVG